MIRVVDHSDAFTRDLIRATEAGLAAAAFEGSEIARASMPGPGAAKYTSPRGKVKYFPSYPGGPPGVRTARLKNDIHDAKTGRLRHGYGTGTKHGRYLELGTRDMPARPWLRPSLAKGRAAIEREFVRTAARHMARSTTARVG